MLLVVVPNAIVDPGAVVIHAGDTAPASRAVVGIWWLDGVALGAIAPKRELKRI